MSAAFQAVQDISLHPALGQLIVGQASTYQASVTPNNATNKDITWSKVAGANCTISQNQNGSQLTVTPQESGAVTLRATIIDGKLQGT
jgi:uncharacterized protein YjdB